MLAIIPARGGSKGLPGKNIKVLNGKPLIAYTIESAQKSKYIDRIVCSTDSQKIADIAIKYGAEVPFLRPEQLASDNALAIDTYIYTIDKLAERGELYSEFIVLLPTSPLRLSSDIDNAVDLFRGKKADSVLSYTIMSHSPTWARIISSDLIPSDYFGQELVLHNRQEREQAYICNGAIYIFNYKLLKERRIYESENTYAYLMSLERSIDIDTLFDFKIAECLLKLRDGK